MKKLLKSNGKPTISGSDKMLYADKNISAKGGHDSYVTDKITYSYSVQNVNTTNTTISFKGITTKKRNNVTVNTIEEEITLPLITSTKLDLKWHNINIIY